MRGMTKESGAFCRYVMCSSTVEKVKLQVGRMV